MKKRLSNINWKIVSLIAAFFIAFIVVFLWYPSELFYMPMQNFDTPAHLYAVDKLLNNGLSEVFHLSPDGGFYPPLFHLIAAGFAQILGLFGGVSVAWIFGAGIVFPIGIYFFTKETLVSVKSHYKDHVLLLAPILAVTFLVFPYSLLDIGTLYAYGFAVSLLPWLLFFAKKFFRALVTKEQNKLIITSIIGVIVSLLFILLAQPRALFFAIPIILVDVIYFIIKQWNTSRKLAAGMLIAGSGVLATFVAGIGYYVFRSLRADLLWHPENWFEGTVPTHSWLEALFVWVGGIPKLFGIEFISIIVIIIIIASIVFAAKKWKNEIAQKFLMIYGLFGIIYVFCVSSESGLAKIISAPWYQNGWRILAIIPVIVIPVFIFFSIKLCEKLSKRNKVFPVFLISAIMISCIVTILFGTASLQLKEQIVSQASINEASLFSQNEYEIAKKLDLEKDSLILADPTTGANYISFFTDYDMVFPVINPNTARQDDLRNIIQAFDKADGAKLKETACSYNKPIYFLDTDRQSNIFGGEHILMPWYSFHNQKIINSFEYNEVFKKIGNDDEYRLYKITCE